MHINENADAILIAYWRPVVHFTDCTFACINLLTRNGNCNGRWENRTTESETDWGRESLKEGQGVK